MVGLVPPEGSPGTPVRSSVWERLQQLVLTLPGTPARVCLCLQALVSAGKEPFPTIYVDSQKDGEVGSRGRARAHLAHRVTCSSDATGCGSGLEKNFLWFRFSLDGLWMDGLWMDGLWRRNSVFYIEIFIQSLKP